MRAATTVGVLVLLLSLAAAPLAGASVRIHPAGDTRPSPAGDRSLASAIEDGTVDASIPRALERERSLRVLVTVDDAGALASARAATAGLPEAVRTDALLDLTVPAYEAAKEDALGDAEVIQDFEALPVSVVELQSQADLQALAAEPGVTGIREDELRRASLNQSLALVRQPQAAQAGATGNGASVAILDTGVDYRRAAFGSCSAPGGACKVAFARDFAPNDNQPDADGHGTNVAAIALGVAPSAKILALDVFQGNGAYDSDVIAAMNWTIENRSTYGTKAVNLSLGDVSYHTSQCNNSSYATPFANLRAAGILPVVASGNDAWPNGSYRNGVSAPACAPGAIRVGAVYDASMGSMNWGDCTDSTAPDKIVCWSQGGPLQSLWAPGSSITAGGLTMSGTSMSTPHVAGAVAVVARANPSATVAQIESALTSTGPVINDARAGTSKRRLDVAAAVAAIGGSTPSPTPTPTPTPDPDPGDEQTTLSGRLTGFYTTSSGYHLYKPWKNVNYAATLDPALSGRSLEFTWQRRNASGTWKNVAVASFDTTSQGLAAVYIQARDVAIGPRYRIGASFAGDGTTSAAATGWSYFRMPR